MRSRVLPGRRRRVVLTGLLGLVLLGEPGPAHAADPPRYFPETGHTIAGAFLDTWIAGGGLAIYGFPLTDPLPEDGRQVQYFERARFEIHPEHAGTPYAVLLSRLGVLLTAGRDFPPGDPAAGVPYFPETQHTLRGAFLAYWQAHGGLPQFGYPISEELREPAADGQSYVVQYFERARFEYHPDLGGANVVLLGHLGRDWLAFRDRAARFVGVFDGQLIAGPDLRPLKLKGFNYYPRDADWTDFGAWPAPRVAAELAAARALGANVLRIFIRQDAFGGAPAGWTDQTAFQHFVGQARAAGCRLIVTLFDGFRKAPQPDWAAWAAAGSWQEARDKAYLTAIVGRWRDEPAILAWDVYNEPDFVDAHEFQWAAQRAGRLDWLARMATEIRRLDPNHLLTVGVALSSSNTQPAGAARPVLDLVDVVSVHYYARNYDRPAAAVLADLRARTRKPLLITETGQATWPGAGSEDDQARFLAAVLAGAQAADSSGALVWTLYDWPHHVGGPEGHYGLLRADDTPKPAAALFRAWAP